MVGENMGRVNYWAARNVSIDPSLSRRQLHVAQVVCWTEQERAFTRTRWKNLLRSIRTILKCSRKKQAVQNVTTGILIIGHVRTSVCLQCVRFSYAWKAEKLRSQKSLIKTTTRASNRRVEEQIHECINWSLWKNDTLSGVTDQVTGASRKWDTGRINTTREHEKLFPNNLLTTKALNRCFMGATIVFLGAFLRRWSEVLGYVFGR